MKMIRDKPVFGYGFDQFKAHYMDYQATWFKQNQASEEDMVAGDNNYSFNEFLQHTVENGVLGLLIIVSVLIIIFRSSGFRNLETSSKSQDWDFIGAVAKAGNITN
jgi:O-antigen ligase